MAETEHAETEAAEAVIADFEESLATMLATVRAMREIGVSAPEIADRICRASKEMVLRTALMGSVVH